MKSNTTLRNNIFALFLLSSLPSFAATYTTLASGNYGTGGTWDLGTAPNLTTGGHEAIIATGHSVTSSAGVFGVGSAVSGVGTLTVNGTLDLGNNELWLGTFNQTPNSAFTATINIGSAGSLTNFRSWIDGVYGTPNGTLVINFLGAGGSIAPNTTGFGIRLWDNWATAPTWTGDPLAGNTQNFTPANSASMYNYLWDQGVLQHNGSSTGAFLDNFSVNLSTGVLTSIPETSSALLGALGSLIMLRRRREIAR